MSYFYFHFLRIQHLNLVCLTQYNKRIKFGISWVNNFFKFSPAYKSTILINYTNSYELDSNSFKSINNHIKNT